MLWLHLHFPQLPLEVFNLPDEDERAIVISDRQRICRVNHVAAGYGIEQGTSLATAQALCDTLLALERRPRSEHALLGNLADWAYRFSSLVSVEPPDSLALEVAASERLFGTVQNLLEQLDRGLKQRSISMHGGIAPTPEGARLLARAAPCDASSLPHWIADDTLQGYRDCIAQLPLDLLDCDHSLQQRLRQSGFRQIGDLLSLPRAAIGRRFGQAMLGYLCRLNAEQPDVRKPYAPPEHFFSVLHFPDPLQNNNGLLFPMQRLLRELSQFLTRRQAFARKILWHFTDVTNQRHELPIACSLEHNNPNATLDLTRLALEHFRVSAMIESLSLSCRQYSQTEQRSDQLFADPQRLDDRQQQDALRSLLDRLSLRLGDSAVYGLAVADEHLPEHGWRTVAAGRTDSSTPALPTAQRPLWLLPTPQRLRHQGRQLYAGRPLQIMNGPERIQARWWSESGVFRDYYTAIDDSGVLYWIYRDRQQGNWYLHGLFG